MRTIIPNRSQSVLIIIIVVQMVVFYVCGVTGKSELNEKKLEELTTQNDSLYKELVSDAISNDPNHSQIK